MFGLLVLLVFARLKTSYISKYFFPLICRDTVGTFNMAEAFSSQKLFTCKLFLWLLTSRLNCDSSISCLVHNRIHVCSILLRGWVNAIRYKRISLFVYVKAFKTFNVIHVIVAHTLTHVLYADCADFNNTLLSFIRRPSPNISHLKLVIVAASHALLSFLI